MSAKKPSKRKAQKLRQLIADECALTIASTYFRAQLGGDVVTEKREDYELADKIMALIAGHLNPPTP